MIRLDPNVSTILLIPADAHREALLGSVPGFDRSGPPKMCRAVPDEPWSPWCGDTVTCTRALVLAHDGRVVREGRDRAEAVLGIEDGHLRVSFDLRHRPPLIFVEAGVHDPCKYIGRSTKLGPFCRHDVMPELEALRGPWCEYPYPSWPLKDITALAVTCAARGLGTVCLLDADGVEVTR